MMTMMKMIIIAASLSMISCLNPIKMSMMIMFISGVTFIIMSEMMGSSWFPLIFYLLFLGGILIMFMVLSSLMPNEKSLKNKLSWTMIVISMLSTMTISLPLTNNYCIQLKWFMQSNFNMFMMILLIMGYFLSFIYMICNEKMSLRSSLCYKKVIL